MASGKRGVPKRCMRGANQHYVEHPLQLVIVRRGSLSHDVPHAKISMNNRSQNVIGSKRNLSRLQMRGVNPHTVEWQSQCSECIYYCNSQPRYNSSRHSSAPGEDARRVEHAYVPCEQSRSQNMSGPFSRITSDIWSGLISFRGSSCIKTNPSQLFCSRLVQVGFQVRFQVATEHEWLTRRSGAACQRWVPPDVRLRGSPRKASLWASRFASPFNLSLSPFSLPLSYLLPLCSFSTLYALSSVWLKPRHTG